MTEYLQHLHPHVEDDAQAAVDYYGEIDPGLAERLVDDLATTLATIRRFPLVGLLLDDRLRHQVLDVFPYMVLYAVMDEQVYVMSLEHVKGDPEGILRRAHRRL